MLNHLSSIMFFLSERSLGTFKEWIQLEGGKEWREKRRKKQMMGPKSNLMAFLGSNQGPNLGGFNNYEAN